jgi:hypothetical protein
MLPPGYRELFIDENDAERGPYALKWIELGELLAGRKAWHWELDDVLWGYGLAGAAVLVLTVSEDGLFILYDAKTDTDQRYAELREFSDQLARLEDANEGFTPLQNELIDYLIPLKLEEWKREQDSGTS